jgi:hypothetical protein
MRKFVSVLARLTMLPTVLVASSVIAGPQPLNVVAQPADDGPKVDNVACWGYGWRGWGVYPGWLRPACTGAWTAPGYVVPAPTIVAPVVVAPVTPGANRCWSPSGPDGRPGHWAAC